MTCKHAAEDLIVKDIKIETDGMQKGSTNGFHWDCSRGFRVIVSVCECDKCGEEVILHGRKPFSTGDWTNVVMFG